MAVRVARNTSKKKSVKKIKIAKKLFEGFTIVELMITVAIFAILAAGVLGAYGALSRLAKQSRETTVLNSLALNYLEIVKNMPYSQVGTQNGNPAGDLADQYAPIPAKIEAFNYQIYYEVTYIDDPSDGTALLSTDSAPNDYKQVKMKVQNMTTGKITTFATNIVPKGLEISTGGALLVNVINSQGVPVSGANVHIDFPTSSPYTIQLDRTTDAEGRVLELDLPVGVNSYRIVVTKAGYSSDQTYPVTALNPNPAKPDATIALGQVTAITFSIDLLSNLNIWTLDNTCQGIGGVGVNVRGDKLIGENPNVYKFNNNYYSSASGLIDLANIEWDTYTPAILANQSWVVAGTSPIQKITVLPGTTQNFNFILHNNTTNYSVLVIVKDQATGGALEGAYVHLRKGGSTPQDYYGYTAGSVWVQNDWTGGDGQETWWAATSTPDRYDRDDGNIDINSMPTGVRLEKITGRYLLNGEFESSTFDTGTNATNYTILTWEPTSQHLSTQLKIQIAAANDPEGPWNYIGPDGTAATYFTVSGSNLPPQLDGNRYVRYKAYLTTTDDKHTPVLTGIEINYVSGCYTPGQVFFPDLTQGQNYDIEVSLPGYATYVDTITIDGHTVHEVFLSP
jgi:prepilin-type N-terminal cleavage/methylation domain-containing protein